MYKIKNWIHTDKYLRYQQVKETNKEARAKMSAVYVIIENGDPYPIAYTTFESAVAVVKAKHKEEIDRQLAEADGYPICSELDTPENKVTGETYLYVEKGIHIRIHKLPILSF